MGVTAQAADLEVEISGVEASPRLGDGWAGPLNPSMRWFQTTHAKRSASFLASAARSAECRTELP